MASAESSVKPKVFCKDCKHLYDAPKTVASKVPDSITPFYNITVQRCKVALVTYDPIRGEIKSPSDPKALNKNFDCPHYTPHGSERIRTGSSLIQPKTQDPMTNPMILLGILVILLGVVLCVGGVGFRLTLIPFGVLSLLAGTFLMWRGFEKL